jgi:hypothetical protein
MSQIFVAMPSGKSFPSDSPLLAYIGVYYSGQFIDRFGQSVTKPTFTNGIQDATISNFVRILLETEFDSFKPFEPVLMDGKNYISGKEPTFHKVFGASVELPVASSGDKGVSAKEYKLIQAGANAIADQGLTLFSGLLKSLSAVNIGLVIAPNFAIGSNATLEDIAQAVIETSLRRGAERGLYCLMAKYNFDKVADIIPLDQSTKLK